MQPVPDASMNNAFAKGEAEKILGVQPQKADNSYIHL